MKIKAKVFEVPGTHYPMAYAKINGAFYFYVQACSAWLASGEQSRISMLYDQAVRDGKVFDAELKGKILF